MLFQLRFQGIWKKLARQLPSRGIFEGFPNQMFLLRGRKCVVVCVLLWRMEVCVCVQSDLSGCIPAPHCWE